uniref:Protocadherin Fat 2 n=1 Tax=Callithrix jacchus TaxID=9483 RepID=A0A8I3WQT8_CALJA|nr:protocadherin Fat 2 isoform X1 [Callithrix jacchus]XP_035144779.1 protocadherin Fat 2 isoform X1 [Callithrix jacchus]XP_054106910.1 protocadherin Fat 2 isoform X1 [Callithrix jacchus]
MTIALLGFAIFLLHSATCEKPTDGILSSSAWHFTHSHYNATIYENSSPKTYVESLEKMGIYLAEPQWAVRYRIISGDVANVFKTEEYVVGNFCFLRIRTKSSNTALLNREVRDSYTLIIQATEKTLELEALTRVVVHILDQNDLKPLFSPPSYRVTISEDTPLKSPICKVTATDADLGQNAEFYYNFNTRSEMFAIHPTSGVVTVAGKLNVTWRGKHELQVLAVDRMRKISEGNGFGSLAALVIHVEPALRKPPAIASVVVTPPDSNDGTTYATVLVDANSSGAEVESVEVVGGDPGKHFKAIKSYARSNEFSLVSVKDINWMEYLHGFNLSLQARSGSGPYFYSQIRGFHLPPSKLASLKFEKAVYRVQLSEFSPPGSRVVMVRVTPAFPDLQYVLKPSSENLGFKLNARTGLITTTKLMDFHDRAHYQLHIRTSPGQASTVVVIDIVDCNNHAPVFNRSSYDGTLDENIPPGTSVLAATATDQDHRENGYVTYSIAGPKALPFSIDPYLGIISTSKPMDYELMKRIYTFRVRASDWGSPFRREKEVSVFLQLRNLNDNQPMFEEVNCTGSIRQDWPVGKSIMTMSAIDVDELQNLKYEIVSGNELEYFDLNHFSGVISLKRSFMNLTAGQPVSYSLKITASDGKHYASPTTLNITVVKDPHFEVPITCDKTGVLTQFTKTILHSIGLQNQESSDEEFTSLSTYQINHYTPQFEDHFPQSIDVLESVPVNTSLARLAATDPDAGFNGKLVYVIADGNEEGCFDIELETGLLTIAAPLDYETTNFYILNVTVYDLGTPQKSSWKLLTVNVKDWNDNAPRFPPGGYQLTISEDTEVGTTIAELTTKDADSEDNGRVRYTLLSPTEKFSLHPLTGELVVTGHLDRESEPQYILKVEARDQPRKGHQLFSVTDLIVTLEDVNDNSPQCITELNRLKVPEDLPPGTVLTFLDASDPDLGPAGEVRYVLMDDAHGTFRVDLTTGALSLERELDFERRAGYNLSLWASDSGRPLARRTLCHVEVIVLDVNENLHPPHFASFVHQGQVQENSPSGTQVMVVAAHDDDSGLDGELQYFLRAGTGLAAFSINQDTGMIQTLAPLDREFASYYWLTVLAVDRGSVPLSSVTEVYIEVTDANDNPPQMSRAVFYPSIQEDAPVGTSVLQLDASDPDSSSKGKLTFNITSGNHMGFFIIHPVTGLLSTARQLDRENKDEHILEVTVLDNGEPPLKSTSRVVVGILDINDNPPAFSHKLFNVRLPERLSPVSPGPVYRLVASDLDEGLNGRVTYSIEESDEEGFSIDPVTGVVSSSSIFTAGEYNILTIKATDNGQPPLSASVRLHIEWIPRPRPSSIPLAFDETHYSFTVMETDPVNHMVGVISVEGRPGLFWFNISGGDKDMDFDIEKTTGSIIIARPLDTRRRSNYNLTVEVTDGSRTIATQVHIFMIANINHHRPQFLETHYEVRVPQDTLPGVELLRVQAIDQDKGKGLIYTIHGSQDPGSASLFQLDPSSGVLVTVGKLDLRSGPSQHTLTVMVRDQEIPIKRNFVWVTIHVENGNLHPPYFTQLHYEASVPDTTAPGTELLQVRAMDADRGANAEVRYTLLKGNGEGFFNINALLGIITLARKLDWANHAPHTLTVKAEDQGSPQWHDLATVIIHVYPSDRSAPIFSKTEYFVEIPESIPVGSPILLVSAMSSSEVTYELREGNKDGVFSMNSYSGLMSTQKNLDHEKISSYQLKIRGSNMAGAFTDVMVVVDIIDENDNAPMFLKSTFVGQISEAAPLYSMIMDKNNNPFVIHASDSDKEANSLLVYKILEPEALKFFKIDPSMGTLTIVSEMDYESRPSFKFCVYVHDQGNPILFAPRPAQVIINVRDVNDSPPRFSEQIYEVAIVGPIHPGMELLMVQASDDDSEVNYSIKTGNADEAVTIHPITGRISVLNPAFMGLSRKLTIRASDGLYQDTALVKIYLNQVLDKSLQFDQDVYRATVRENLQDRKTLVILGAQGNYLNDTLSYFLLNGTDMFHMVQSAGVLQTRGVVFDREQQDTHELAVEVRDNRTPQRIAQALVQVSIEDVNDNPPKFKHLPYYTIIQDGTEPGDVLFQVSATDEDLGTNGAITYTFAEDYTYFRIDPYLGDISLRKPFDYQALNKYRLKVIARDGGMPSLQSEEEVLVTVRNKSNPLFQSPYYKVRVPENITLYTPILHTQARSPEGLRLIYNIVEEEPLMLFTTDFKTGVLTVTGPLDYESKTKHVFTVRATDTALGSFSEATVEVLVEDVNDNPPTFSQLVYTTSISEGLPAQTPVIQLLASDQDSGRNRDVSYQIVEDGSDVSKFFQINGSTGEMSTVQELDYEAQQHFHVKVRAMDKGDPPLTGETLVVVNVSDINDNPPEFRQSQYEANVSELATCGHLVLRVQAIDPDSRDTSRLQYLILSGNQDRHFSINSSSGIISMFNLCKKHLDSSYNLRVGASDGVFRATVPVYINTTNANKYSPEFQQHLYEAELAENAMVGTKVIDLLAIDKDSGPYGTIDYTIINKLASEKFSINPNGQIATLQKLDRENSTERVIAIKVMAQDGGGRVAFCTVKIILTDENDNPPQFKASAYTVSIQSNVSKDSPVIQVLAYDADEGQNADVTYSVNPEDLVKDVIEINPVTGVVKVKDSLVGLENRTIDFIIKAQDGGPPHWNSQVPVRLQVVPKKVSLPKFSEPLYTFPASEDLPEGSEIGVVKAVAAHDPVIYSLVRGTTPESNKDGVFSLDPDTGVIKVRKTMDHESTKLYQIDVMAHCLQNTDVVSLVSVNIQVIDVNDNRPVFEADPYKAVLTENMPVGTSVIQVTAIDKDTGRDGQVSYRLSADPSSNVHELFAIDSESGWITTLQELDCETCQTYNFHVVAYDHGRTIQLSSQALVQVSITDENDNAPRFASEEYRGSVIENSEPGELVATLKTLDADISEQNRQVTCYITEGDPLGQFGISQVEDEWRISSRKTLDREHMAKYLLRVTASDGKFQASVTVEIFVLDVNDNSPQCSQLLYTGKVHEDVFPGHFILKVSATDLDADTNAQITYSLHGPGAHEFKLDPHTGELTTLTPLDRERKDVFNLVVKATDGGGRSCQADVTLHVEDVNDNAPRFFPSHCAVAVFDNTTVKTPVAVVFARDPDQGPNAQVVYSLPDSAEGHFSIDATTGVIRLEKPLQVRPQAPLELTVRASDLGTPIPLSTLSTVTVSVVGLEDYLPVFLNTEHSVQVPEDTPPGTEVLQLAPLTRPGAEKTGYRVVSGNEQGRFRLDARTGILYVNASLDFETSPKYFLSIECTRKSSSSLSDITTVVVNITDVNEHRPRFPQDPYNTRVLENALVGDVILTVSATDEDGPLNSDITYSLVGGNQLGHFIIHPKKGELQVAKALDWEQASSYSLKLRATDSGQPPLHEDTDIAIQVADVNDNPPRFFQLNYSTTVQENSPIGSKVLQLILSDLDSPENGPPYSFRITKGNTGSAFRVTPDGWLVTAEGLSKRVQEWYQLQIQASDSGIPPLSSSTSVRIHVTEKSHYAPSALPLEIFITVGEEEFQGGMVGKIHATDRDPQDTLTYSLAEEETLGRYFSVGTPDGKIIAAQSLPCGRYSFNVTVSDGTFTTTAGVHVYVWHVGREALQQAVWMGFYQLTPEELVSDHWRNLQRFLSHKLDIKRANIHLASLQPAEAVAGVDVLLVFEGHSGTLYELQELASIIIHSAKEMEHSVGVQMRSAMPVVPCQGPTCQGQICHDTVHMDPKVGPTYSTARLSILTPRHRLQRSCSCNGTAARFSGQSYVRYRPPAARNWHISFYLKTLQPQAILLFTNETASISLKLASGVLQLEYHCLGGFYGNLSSQRHVNDHEWHFILVEETDTSIRLMVDSMGNASLVVPENCHGLRPERHLFLGGLVLSHSSFNVSQGFEGCLDAVVVNEEALELLVPDKTVAGLLETQALTQCCPHSNYCSQNPCLNGGKCLWTHGAGYVCKCPPQFSGKHCEQGRENCTFAPCLEGGTCIPSPKGASCNCPHPYTGDRCEMEARGCSEGHCLVTPEIKRGDWGQQELLIIVVTIVFIIISTVGLLYYCRRCKSHKPVAMEDPDLLARSVGVDTQAMPAIELNPLSASSCNNLNQPEPSKTSVPNELVTFAPNSKQRPVVCSVPPRLPPAAVPSHSDNEPVIKRTWSGEEMVYPGGATVWPPTYSRNERWEYPHSEVTHGPLPPSTHRHSTPVVMPEPAGLYGGFPFPLEMENKRAPLPPRYSNQNLEDLMPSRPPSPRERLLAPCLNEYTAISYYHSQFRQGGGGPSLAEGGYKGVSMRLSRAGPSYAVCEVEGAPLAGQGQPRAPPIYEGSDMVESDYGSCEEVMF